MSRWDTEVSLDDQKDEGRGIPASSNARKLVAPPARKKEERLSGSLTWTIDNLFSHSKGTR